MPGKLKIQFMHGGGHFLNITFIIAIILPVLSFCPYVYL